MKRITFNKFNSMKVNEQRELLHNLYVATDACQTVKTEMAFAFNPWKAAYELMVEAYDTSYKSEETDEIHTLDQMCDNLLVAGHGAANGLAKSPDPVLSSAAKVILQAYKSFKVVYTSSYISQKPQVDSLLYALLVTNRDSVETCGLLPIYERVRELNDRMHELVDQRDQTLPDPQRTVKREAAIARCLDLFDYINGYWLVTLHMTNVPVDLEQFFFTTDNIFKRYDRVLGLGANSTTRPGVGEDAGEGEEGSPTDPNTPSEPNEPNTPNNPPTTTEPTLITALFTFHGGEIEEIKAEAGAALTAPANTEGYRWEPEVPAAMPDADTSYTEVEDDAEVYTVTWYTAGGNPIKSNEVAAGATIPAAPQPPTGYRWPEYPSVMPPRDLDIIAVAI